ncbi:MAG: DNA polymerase III subunit [Planctomycetota bacterium]
MASAADASSIELPPTTWNDLIGHDRIVEAIGVALQRGRLSGSLLIVGPAGVGKTTLAMLLARTILCDESPPAKLSPCGNCQGCKQVLAGTHPDLVQASKPPDKTLIPLERLIGPPEARLRRGFCHDIHLRPTSGRRKVAILHDVDYLNEEGANCLLKTLEEPPGDALILLIGTSEQRQLPTIRSRCQILRLSAPRGEQAVGILRRHLAIAPPDSIPEDADLSDQSLAEAVQLAAGDLEMAMRLVTGYSESIRTAITAQLRESVPDPAAMTRVLTKHLDAAGKESNRRRAAFKDACTFILQHYRHQLRHDARQGVYDPATDRRLDRTLRVFREIDRMANLSTLVECYAADLTLAQTGDRGQIG